MRTYEEEYGNDGAEGILQWVGGDNDIKPLVDMPEKLVEQTHSRISKVAETAVQWRTCPGYENMPNDRNIAFLFYEWELPLSMPSVPARENVWHLFRNWLRDIFFRR